MSTIGAPMEGRRSRRGNFWGDSVEAMMIEAGNSGLCSRRPKFVGEELRQQ